MVPNLLQQNLYSKYFKDQFLLIGTCVENMHPEVLKKFTSKWKNVLSICLEIEHYNKMVAKLFDILGTGNVKKIGFLTVNGSPHCVQVHFASKYLKRGLNKEVIFEHYVVSDDGKVFSVSMDEINESRDYVKRGKLVALSSNG